MFCFIGRSNRAGLWIRTALDYAEKEVKKITKERDTLKRALELFVRETRPGCQDLEKAKTCKHDDLDICKRCQVNHFINQATQPTQDGAVATSQEEK